MSERASEHRSSSNDQGIQAFLDRASPVIFEQQTVDEDAFHALNAIGDQAGLDREQFLSILAEMERREVVKFSWRPTDWPTPALIAPSLSEPPSGDRGIVYLSPTEPSPPPVVTPPPVVVPPDNAVDRKERIESFQNEARGILAENRGMTARSRLMLADAAHDLGLSEANFDEAMASLGVDLTTSLPPAPVNDEVVETEKIRPEDSYRTYLRIAIADKKLSRGSISENAERKMVNEGARKLDLSLVWARQLLREVALQLDVPLLSDQKPEPIDGEEDAMVATFSRRAKPILAQFRGLNAQSRVRLSALADELGLTETQRHYALSLLQVSAGDESNSAFEMRQNAYREFVEDFFAELSQGILSPALVLELEESGELRFGVGRSSAAEIVRSSAEEAGIATISSDQAFRHLEGLIGEQVGANTVTPSDVRELLYAEGEQWGIDHDEVAGLIKERCNRNRRKRQRERRTTNLVLALACLAVVILFGAFFWVVVFDAKWPLRLPASEPIRPPAETEVGDTVVSDHLTPQSIDMWWSADLQVQAVNLRRTLSVDHRLLLASIRSMDEDVRGTAYEQLIDQHHAEMVPLAVGEFLIHCFAEEVGTAAARRLVEAMVQPIPETGSTVPENDEALASMVRVIEWVARVTEASDISSERIDLLSDVLYRSLDLVIDNSMSRGELRDACMTALARRLYENLLNLASTEALKAFRLSGNIVAMARKELPRAEFDRLGLRLFRSTLKEKEIDSFDFDSLLSEIIGETDDASVLRGLVDVLRDVEVGDIRDLLERRLLSRAGLVPDGSKPVADRVSDALGLDKSKSKPSTPAERWIQLREVVEPAISTLVSETGNVSIAIQSVIRAGYMQALATSLLVDPTGGEYRRLVARGEDSFQPDLDFDRVFGFEGSSPRFIGGKNLKSYTDRIRNNRVEVKRRSAFLGLVRNAESFDDLEPTYAEIVGTYLAIRREVDDMTTLLPHVDAIAHWHNVRLALGRLLSADPFYNEGRQLLVESFIGRPLDVPQSDRWGKHAQLVLIESVVRDLENTETVSGEDMMSSFAVSAVKVDKELIRLLGPVSELAEDVTPAGTSRALIASVAERFGVDNKSKDYDAWVQALPHKLAASDSLDLNELQRTVVYDRIRLETLFHAVLAVGIDVDKVEQLREEITEMDRGANDAMGQLVDGRVHQLKVLMLMVEQSVE
jgi:hypothetical protein